MSLFNRSAHTRSYRNRSEAGKLLATALAGYEGAETLVLGIPRGGVPVAAEVARGLSAELDVVVARKLGAPMNKELAIGAVTANGGLFLNHDLIYDVGATQDYLDAEISKESAVAHQREDMFRGEKPVVQIQGRVVIIVDDGLATGATMRAAVHSVRILAPAKLIVAVPVGSQEACAALRREADEVVCLQSPEPFIAVGLYFQEFDPVEDDEVKEIIRLSATRAAETPTAAPVIV